MTRIFPVDEPSRVAEIRRTAAAMSRAEALDEHSSASVALVTTEACTNLLKHAKRGEVLLSTLSDRFQPGVEILAIDRGPGMPDLAQCLVDGYSSAKTSGTGLGAIARLSQQFDIYSDETGGTVLVARIIQLGFPGSREIRPASFFYPPWVGAVQKPIKGEEVCGDSWAFAADEDAIALIVADGLGHGAMAARASEEAIGAFRRSVDHSPLAVLKGVHGSLRATRGAAVAVAFVERRASTVRYAGIGNIAGAVVAAGKPSIMVSHNGTAGYQSPRLQEFCYPLHENALLIMHSDGLHTNWNLDRYPGLQRCHPSVIAGVLYRDFARDRDDVCVVVARTGGSS